jgi:rhamnose transport system permease protein
VSTSVETFHEAPAARGHAAAEFISRFRGAAIAAVILVVFLATTAKSPTFAHSGSIQEILSGAALFILLAVGETMVIVTRNVDLSVGSTLGLSAFEVGELYTHHPHASIFLALAIGIGIGLACGVVIGLIVTLARVPSLVVTLAALYIIRGYVNVIGSGVQIEPSAVPQNFQSIGTSTILGGTVPWLFVIVIVIAMIGAYWMRAFPAGRELYAIGSNPEAAELVGIPVARRVLTAFAVSGALAGLGGALFLATYATVDATGGTGYELLVISAVVVGGVAIFGGSGSIVGAALGAVLLQVINQSLVTLRISAFWDQAIAGALLLLAIAFDRLISFRASRALRAKEGATYVG